MITEPTQEMLDAARDWSREKYGKPIGSADATGCWKAMAAAAPAQPVIALHITDEMAVAALRAAMPEPYHGEVWAYLDVKGATPQDGGHEEAKAVMKAAIGAALQSPAIISFQPTNLK
jgi:hypothetical protein